MLIIRTSFDMREVQRAIGATDRMVPYAAATALTRTAQDVKKAEEATIRNVFDRPTPYTQRSVYLRPATKSRLQAVVWLKDGNRPQHYLVPDIIGGQRPMKRFEQRLRMTGYMHADERAVPGTAAQLDSYGNISRGLIVRILSQLRTAVVQGDYSNASNSKRSRAKRATVQYFVARNDKPRRGFKGKTYAQNLPNGIWERRRFAWGSTVRPVMLFVQGARYSKRFPFDTVATKTINAYFRMHFEKACRTLVDAWGQS